MPDDSLNWALSEWPLWGGCHVYPTVIKPLLGGLTNKSYLLDASGKQFVLRVLASNSAELDIDRKAEQTASRLSSAAGLSPRIIYLDPSLRYSIAEYVEGVVLSESHHSERKKLELVAKTLKKLHAIDIEYHNLPSLNVVEKAERYWSVIVEKGLHNGLIGYQDALQGYFRNHAESLSGLCLCHNDPVANNLLATATGLQLIDWEYASAGKPLYDVALFIESEQLSAEQEGLFLADYANDVDKSALSKAKLDVLYLEWLWWLAQDKRNIDEKTAQKLMVTESQLLGLIEAK